MIADSGNRTEFDTGAVRDIQEGKGRCDLMPLDVVSMAYVRLFGSVGYAGMIFNDIYQFAETGKTSFLYDTLHVFVNVQHIFIDLADMFLAVAQHFEEGAKKYGERNWEKGIPLSRYIDSATRHYLKVLRGDTDEPHDRAFVWNIMCAIWTAEHKPELNEYRNSETRG